MCSLFKIGCDLTAWIDPVLQRLKMSAPACRVFPDHPEMSELLCLHNFNSLDVCHATRPFFSPCQKSRRMRQTELIKLSLS